MALRFSTGELNFLRGSTEESLMKMILLFFFISLGSLFAQIQDQESEVLRAMRLSCEKQKVALGCFNYANMLIRLDRADQADAFFDLGCKLDHSPSCQKEKWTLPAPEKKADQVSAKETATAPEPAPEPETDPAPAPETPQAPEAGPEVEESPPTE